MFSVVIPLYNKAHTIVKTLNSVLDQQFTAFEVVIVNDGSTDGGADLVRRTFSDPRIRIIDQPNQGVSAARNTGVGEARYDLVAFLDGDDELLPEYLLKMKQAVDLFPEGGMYCCGGLSRYPDGAEFRRYSPRYRKTIRKVNFFENPYFFGNSSSTIIRKSGFAQAGGFPLGMKYNEDLVFFFKLALQVEVVFCPEPLSVYNKGVEGQASAHNDNNYRIIIERSNIVYQFWNTLKERNHLFLVFTLYEMRGMLLDCYREKKAEKVRFFLDHTEPGLLRQFHTLEKFLYARSFLRLPAMLWIYAAKVRWRLRRFPVLRYVKHTSGNHT